MSFDIFRVDWILVDSIISVVLIIFLVGVNIVKKLYRWRFPLSNRNLEKITIKTSSSENLNVNKGIKKWTITYPKDSPKSDDLATIIIIRTFRKFMLLNALTEGLSSYGFNVINIWIKKSRKSIISEDLDKFLFSDIIKHQYTKKLKFNNSYFLLASGRVPFKNYTRLLDIDNLGIVILDPIMKVEDILDIRNPTKLYGIFSEKSNLFFRNSSLKKTLKLKGKENTEKIKVKVIKSARRSFRYYETILLGELIKIFNNNLNKQKQSN